MFSCPYGGNRLAAGGTNVLYDTMLLDMEACYKVMRSEVLRGMVLPSRTVRDQAEQTRSLPARLPRPARLPITSLPMSLPRGQEDHLARRVSALRPL